MPEKRAAGEVQGSKLTRLAGRAGGWSNAKTSYLTAKAERAVSVENVGCGLKRASYH